MDEKIRQGYLYDFYGELLTAKQRKIYEKYIFFDLSLTEIAEEEGISRQGVHDMLKRCTKILHGYEEKLHLAEKFMHIKQKVSSINELTMQQESQKVLEEIRLISNDILGEL